MLLVQQHNLRERRHSYSLLEKTSELNERDYTVSQKNDTDVTHYRFNPHQPFSIIFGRDVEW